MPSVIHCIYADSSQLQVYSPFLRSWLPHLTDGSDPTACAPAVKPNGSSVRQHPSIPPLATYLIVRSLRLSKALNWIKLMLTPCIHAGLLVTLRQKRCVPKKNAKFRVACLTYDNVDA